jgi:hypothetical protein
MDDCELGEQREMVTQQEKEQREGMCGSQRLRLQEPTARVDQRCDNMEVHHRRLELGGQAD